MQADEYWRGDGDPSAAPRPDADGGPGSYPGPPAMTPPPADWRPPMVVEPPPPRRLPTQDHLAIDQDEASARVFTRGVGLVVAAVLMIFSCLLCGQRLF